MRSYTFRYLRKVATEATVDTTSPVIKRIPEATQTSDQVKNLVKLSSGAILESTNNLNPETGLLKRPIQQLPRLFLLVKMVTGLRRTKHQLIS